MIELRWLEFEYTPEKSPRLKGKKLQYRTKERDTFGSISFSKWSDWNDVPTVQEEKNETP